MRHFWQIKRVAQNIKLYDNKCNLIIRVPMTHQTGGKNRHDPNTQMRPFNLPTNFKERIKKKLPLIHSLIGSLFLFVIKHTA